MVLDSLQYTELDSKQIQIYHKDSVEYGVLIAMLQYVFVTYKCFVTNVTYNTNFIITSKFTSNKVDS